MVRETVTQVMEADTPKDRLDMTEAQWAIWTHWGRPLEQTRLTTYGNGRLFLKSMACLCASPPLTT